MKNAKKTQKNTKNARFFRKISGNHAKKYNQKKKCQKLTFFSEYLDFYEKTRFLSFPLNTD